MKIKRTEIRAILLEVLREQMEDSGGDMGAIMDTETSDEDSLSTDIENFEDGPTSSGDDGGGEDAGASGDIASLGEQFWRGPEKIDPVIDPPEDDMMGAPEEKLYHLVAVAVQPNADRENLLDMVGTHFENWNEDLTREDAEQLLFELENEGREFTIDFNLPEGELDDAILHWDGLGLTVSPEEKNSGTYNF